MRILLLLMIIVLTSCAGLNNSLTPGAKVAIDDFDGSVNVRQDPVSSSSSLSEAFHSLGFRWTSKLPNQVFLIVKINSITNIQGLDFNIDKEIAYTEEGSKLTSRDENFHSLRQFTMPLNTFRKMASAKDVKMKVIYIDSYSVSSFGVGSSAVVSLKFDDFLKKVDAELKKL